MTGVAMLGRISPLSPSVTTRVAEILPSAALEIQLQLPIEALAMGNRNGQIIGFQRLVVAIDSYDELLETNEANNLRAWNCAEIPVLRQRSSNRFRGTETATETVATDVTETASQVQSTDWNDEAVIRTSTIAPSEQSPDAIRKAIEQIGTDEATLPVEQCWQRRLETPAAMKRHPSCTTHHAGGVKRLHAFVFPRYDAGVRRQNFGHLSPGLADGAMHKERTQQSDDADADCQQHNHPS